ncbi:unnamed protein product [Paramecium sonneborni]|uniref:Uncharacterized protein n=1 Tax=Paramecium sonneborni TaxID=65129 RepID=A0A8S1MX89_9CILI|nr:unnamed protein product [Paramecium sonneborni]
MLVIIIKGDKFQISKYPDEDHWRNTHPPPLNFQIVNSNFNRILGYQ